MLDESAHAHILTAPPAAPRPPASIHDDLLTERLEQMVAHRPPLRVRLASWLTRRTLARLP